MDFEINKEITIEITLKVRNFKPSRPAPACQNHDSPAFSDSGDDAEYQDVEVFFGGEQLPKNLADAILEILEEDNLTSDIIDQGEELAMDRDGFDSRDFDEY